MGTANSKIPLRGLATLFTHLGANTKAQITSAFAEAEDLMNTHNNSIVDHQERRFLSGEVSSPILTTTTNSRGFDVQWTRLDDKAISMYEIQISTNSIFSNPDSYKVVDTSFSLEGIGSTVYARVRGVQFNGNTGPWSDPATINAFALSGGPVVYSRGLDDIPSFYISDPASVWPAPLQRIAITPQRQNGGVVVFGSFGIGFGGIDSQYGDTTDVVQVTINEQVIDNINLQDFNGNPTWADGSHSDTPFNITFGPAFLFHSDFYFSTSDFKNPNTVASVNPHGAAGTHTGWLNTANATGAMETNFGAVITDGATTYNVTNLSRGQSSASRFLDMTNFGFTIPTSNTILGIQVQWTGAWSSTGGMDSTKSFPQVNIESLIDETGTAESFSGLDNIPWPHSTTGAFGVLESVTVGNSSYLWGRAAGFWTPTKLNSSNFGVRVRGKLRISSSDTIGGTGTSTTIYLYGLQITVWSFDPTNAQVRVDVKYLTSGASNHKGGGETLTNLTLNVTEFGEPLSV